MLIDTPGLRSLGLWADPDAVAASFDDVESLASGCRFADCRHDGEPGCAVQAAIADGELAAERLDAWRSLLREAEAAARRADPHLRRAYERRFSRVAKEAQRRKGRKTLHEPADLAAWLAEPPLSAVMTVPVNAADLTAAKTLRQTIWDAAHARAAQRPLPAEAVATINRAVAAPPLVPELAAEGTTTSWAPPVGAAQALSALSREMIGLLTGPLAGRIRECAGDNCPLVFVDSSRPGARR